MSHRPGADICPAKRPKLDRFRYHAATRRDAKANPTFGLEL